MTEMPSEMDQQTYTTVYDVQVQGEQGLNSMLAITQQYSAAADNLLGRVARLNTGFAGMAKHYVGMRPLNAAAVSEAARYQQQLQGLEATTVVATKGNTKYHESFNELRKDTKALAREFPIGMTQAIQQVDALHQSGVKTNREIRSLSKTYTELGKATGEYGPALGSDMQSLNRMYDANVKQARGYADSLTEVTAKLGGTASGTLNFAKAIGPVARTVGLGETAVIGMSNAFSRMGEDGYGAATAVNKVMLDLNRSIRQGTPEVATYARLMNMDTSNLTELFKSHPDEVLTKFFDALQKRGPDAITELENLGLDGVRTVRAVQAAAQGGGLGESIRTAVAGYNSGATKTGAKAATADLNDELAKLQETTRQTVEATGRPFLSWLTDIAKLSNAAAAALRGIVNNPVMQGIGKVGAGVGTVGGGILQVAQIGVLGALGRNLLRGGVNAYRDARQDFRIGRQAMVATGDMSLARSSAEGSMMMAGMGARWGAFTGEEGKAPGDIRPFRARMSEVFRAGGEASRRAALAGMGTTTSLLRASSNEVIQARTDQRPISDARRLFRQQMEEARKLEEGQARMAARAAATRQLMSTGLMQDVTLPAAARATGAEWLRSTRLGIGYAAGGTRALLGAGARGIGAGAVGMLGTAATAINPAMLGIGAIGGLLYANHQANQRTADAASVVGSSVSDPYRAYNEFAAAIGVAGKSASGFANAAEEAAKRLNDINPDAGDAYKFTAQEAAQARGYTGPHGIQLSDSARGRAGFWQRAVNIADRFGSDLAGGFGNDAKWSDDFRHGGAPDRASTSELTAKIAYTLGSSTSKSDVSRALFDLGSQGVSRSQVQAVANNLKKIYGPDFSGTPSAGMGVSAAISSQRRVSTAQGATNDARDFMSSLFGSVGEAGENAGAVYGDKSAQVAQYERLNQVMQAYTSQRSGLDKRRRGVLDKLYAAGVADALGIDAKDVQSNIGATDVGSLLSGIRSKSKDVLDARKTYGGFGISGPITQADVMRVGQIPEATTRERAARASLDADFEKITGFKAHAQAWDKGLHGVEEQLFSMGKTLQTGGKALEKGMDPLQRALYELQTNTPDTRRQFLAGQQLAQAQMGYYGRNAGMASLGLAVSGSKVTDPRLQQGYAAAQEYLQNVIQPVQQAQQSPIGGLRRQMQAGAVAAQQLQNDKFDDPNAQAAAKALVEQAAQAQAQLISMRRQYQQQIIDTGRQLMYAEQDEHRAEARLNQDYQRQRLYSEQDYDTQIGRARRDFNRSIRRAEQDYHIQRQRAEEDYQRTRLRALEDFHRQETRAIEDHNRQVSYMLKDAASQYYNPFQRIQARDVMDASGLASNIQQQADMLRKQSANIKKLLELGLSQRTIDALDLYNPDNAYQVERLVQDITNDRQQAANLNTAVSDKDAAAAPLATSNEQFRRSEEEFKLGLSRSQEDFSTSLERMAEDNRIGMDRMAEDFHKSISRARKDFATSMSDAAEDYERAQIRMRTANKTTLTRMREDLETNAGRAWQSLEIAGKQLNKGAAAIADESAKAIAGAPKAWQGPLLSNIAVMTRAMRQAISAGLTGALNANVSVTIGSNTNATVAEYGSGSSTGTGMTIPWSIFGHAEGGIAQRPHLGVIAEAGYPEALIPLNDRGASMLSEVMRRYAASDQTRGMYGQSYAAPPTQQQHFSYDYSTRIEHVTVVASDPHEMFRALEDIASTQRLVQPAAS